MGNSKSVHAFRHYLLTSSAAAMLAACSGIGGSPPAPVGAALRPAWSAPDANRATLLYVSDANNGTVSVFSYPQGDLVGTLTGFEEPYGLCSDKAGNVWIVDDETSTITEYAHGGTSPKATLGDSGEYPAGCSVDPTTGNLAVTNYETVNRGQGSVSIYHRAKGTPTQYVDASISRGWFCSYDDKGDLFFDGDANGSSGFQLAELPHGGVTFTNIGIDQTITVPGGVQWDGKYVVVTDQTANAMYQYAVTGTKATLKGTITLMGSGDCAQTWIGKGAVFCADNGGEVFQYPAGGSPIAVLTGNYDLPLGTVAANK